jgi:hypothetical protein
MAAISLDILRNTRVEIEEIALNPLPRDRVLREAVRR